MPDIPGHLLKPWVVYFYYLNDFVHAKELSYKASAFLKLRAEHRFAKNHLALGVGSLFESALYRSLAQRADEALGLWQEVIDKRRQISEEQLLIENMSHLWVYEAYSLERLGRYNEVHEPAMKGFHGINTGKTLYDEPRRNSHVYMLVELLINLASYQVSPSREGQRKVQEALVTYKNENLKYGRLGYDIIFDLQSSYPDIFEPILPGADPEQD